MIGPFAILGLAVALADDSTEARRQAQDSATRQDVWDQLRQPHVDAVIDLIMRYHTALPPQYCDVGWQFVVALEAAHDDLARRFPTADHAKRLEPLNQRTTEHLKNCAQCHFCTMVSRPSDEINDEVKRAIMDLCFGQIITDLPTFNEKLQGNPAPLLQILDTKSELVLRYFALSSIDEAAPLAVLMQQLMRREGGVNFRGLTAKEKK